MNDTPPTTPRNHWSIIAVGGLFLLAAFAVVYALRAPGPATSAGAGSGSARSIDEILNAALALKRESQFAKAEVILKQACIEHPTEQRLFIEYAEILGVLKRPEEAYTHYSKAIGIGPRTAALELAAGTTANMATGLSNNLAEAEKHYAAAQAMDRADWKAPLFLAQIQIKIGTPEKIEEAKKNLLIAAKLQPDMATPWGTLADLALRENKPEIALQHIARARELEPQVTLWRVVQARALKRQNKPEDAIKLLVGLDDAQIREPGVLATMAECFGMLQRPADAAKAYSKASDSNTDNGEWALEAALWWEKAADKAAMLKYAQRADAMGQNGAAAVLERAKQK